MGSTPIGSKFLINIERMTEWLKVTDCKSVSESFHWFESNFSHYYYLIYTYLTFVAYISFNFFKLITISKNLVLVQSEC